MWHSLGSLPLPSPQSVGRNPFRSRGTETRESCTLPGWVPPQPRSVLSGSELTLTICGPLCWPVAPPQAPWSAPGPALGSGCRRWPQQNIPRATVVRSRRSIGDNAPDRILQRRSPACPQGLPGRLRKAERPLRFGKFGHFGLRFRLRLDRPRWERWLSWPSSSVRLPAAVLP